MENGTRIVWPVRMLIAGALQAREDFAVACAVVWKTRLLSLFYPKTKTSEDNAT